MENDNIIDDWIIKTFDKRSIDCEGNYYYLKNHEGWSERKIYEEFTKSQLEFENHKHYNIKINLGYDNLN